MFDHIVINFADQLQIVGHVVAAAVFGALIGLEREYANKPAGLRTHALVAGASALLVGLADVLIEYFNAETVPQSLRSDPIRIVEAIVTGVAFLGAGTIFRHSGEDSVEGLTTAASLLLVAGIGIAAALSQWIVASLVTLLALVLLRVARRFKPGK